MTRSPELGRRAFRGDEDQPPGVRVAGDGGEVGRDPGDQQVVGVDVFGRVDAVVVNAGIGQSGPLLTMDPSSYERVIEVNLIGSVRTVRVFLPALIQSRGHVLQVASLAATVHAPLMSAYAASKAGVEAFAQSLRPELAHYGVTVGVAYLAFTDTAMVQAADAAPALKALRTGLPGPFGTTYPLDPAVRRIVAGLERRAPTSTPRGGCG